MTAPPAGRSPICGAEADWTLRPRRSAIADAVSMNPQANRVVSGRGLTRCSNLRPPARRNGIQDLFFVPFVADWKAAVRQQA